MGACKAIVRGAGGRWGEEEEEEYTVQALRRFDSNGFVSPSESIFSAGFLTVFVKLPPLPPSPRPLPDAQLFWNL